MFNSGNILKYLVLVMLFLMTVAIGSFFFDNSSFRDKDVIFEIEAPEQASSGDEVIYKVKYSNNTKTTLNDIAIRFFYPNDAVIMVDGKPTSETSYGFQVERLYPGQSGEKEFPVYLVGDRGDIKNVRASMNFGAGTLRSSFEKTALASTTITNVPITLTLVAPPNVISGQAITYLLDYRNNSGADISDLIFEFIYPDGFTHQSFQPSPSQGNNVWSVDSLRSGGGSRIAIQGILLGSENSSKIVEVRVKRKIGDVYVDYQKASSDTVISNPLLGLNIKVNNVQDYSASLGDNLSYQIDFENTSNYNLLGLTLSVTLEGDMYDFQGINLGGGFFDDTTKTVFWNASVYPDLAALRSGMKGTVIFSIPVKSQFSASVPGASRDRFVKATIRLGTPNVPQGLGGDEVSTAKTIVTRITSQPTFNQFLYYNDSQFGSSGPFPPKAGQETLFTIRWQLANPGNDISNAEVSAVLPPGVEWVNNTSVSQGQPALVYNPNATTVTWKLGTLPFGIGAYAPRYEAAFQVKIRPVTSQAGSKVIIIDSAAFTGVDAYTQQQINIKGQKLNTGTVVDRPEEGNVVP